MTAIDLRASTMQILERFDKTDTSLWQKVLDAINSIYKNEEEAQQAKRAQQKAKIRQMVGILHAGDAYGRGRGTFRVCEAERAGSV